MGRARQPRLRKAVARTRKLHVRREHPERTQPRRKTYGQPIQGAKVDRVFASRGRGRAGRDNLVLGIPDYRQVDLADQRPAGGTTGARVATDRDGREWLVKHYSGNRDRVATELLANTIYRELGILVPNAGVIEWTLASGRTVIALTYPMLDGEIRRWDEPNAELAKGFVADALLANWDVIGLNHDNILWQGDTPVRLDQGGTFEFRAQGKRKEYGPEPVELESMLSPEGQARGRMAVTQEAIEQGAALVVERLTPARVEELISEAPFGDREMAGRLRVNLDHRIAWLRRL